MKAQSLGDAFVMDALKAVTGDARSALEAVLSRWQGQVIYLSSRPAREARIKSARAVLDAGIKGHEAVSILVQRWGCSRRTARGYYQKALNLNINRNP